MTRPRDVNQILTGLLLVAVAVFTFWQSWPLRSFVDVGLGAGYVPKALAIFVFFIGCAMIGLGLVSAGEAPEAWQLRPLALVLASVAYFALTIERLGLVVALIGLVLIAGLADREARPVESVLVAIGSVVFCVVVFVKALGMTVRLWPPMPGAW